MKRAHTRFTGEIAASTRTMIEFTQAMAAEATTDVQGWTVLEVDRL